MTDETSRLDAIARSRSTVADKIRALAAAGVPRADIARFLGKRYQHVRNVLEGDAQSGGGYVIGRADLSGVQERPAPYRAAAEETDIDRRSPGVFWLRLRPDGSLLLPAEVAEALEAAPGRRVFAQLKDGRLEIISADRALEEASELVCRLIPASVDLAESLIDDRRAEAAREWPRD
ncbi:MAG TPA: AbrB/MazE/SpoVT family DNA-binding domain-containing protein [Caulobacteraceae bacterium]|nr:AbrB/MazE/SpoVT family DNA-binding domain-containing protein [Caulobacteraceae bacterium]